MNSLLVKTTKKNISKKSFIPKEQLGVGCADIGPLEKRYVMDVLNKQRLSYGPYSMAFEKEFAKAHHCEFAIFCNSGTSALQVAVAALKENENWQNGDEILVPALTFVATSNVVIQNNLTPIFVDADPTTYNIDPHQLEKKIGPRTKAILLAHLFGLPCDMDPIMEIARKHKLKVIEDSCETMFVRYKGKPVGSFGDIACFSTYVAHLLVTGVGGLSTTNNPELAIIMKSLMNHGRDSIYLSIDDDKKKNSEKLLQVIGGRFRFIRVGYSYRATEMEAALGLGQLQRRKKILKNRQENARKLLKKLTPLSEFLQLPHCPEGREHAFMMFPIVLKTDQIKKEDLVFYLEKNQIETRDMLPLVNQPIYQSLYGQIEDQYPVAKRINSHGFYIGCHQGLGDREINYMAENFFTFFREKNLI